MRRIHPQAFKNLQNVFCFNFLHFLWNWSLVFTKRVTSIVWITYLYNTLSCNCSFYVKCCKNRSFTFVQIHILQCIWQNFPNFNSQVKRLNFCPEIILSISEILSASFINKRKNIDIMKVEILRNFFNKLIECFLFLQSLLL